MSRYGEFLKRLCKESRLRRIPEETDGMLDLVSNDYLGLAARETEFYSEFFNKYPDATFSSSAARLLSRRQKYHFALEKRLEHLYGKSVLLYNSGYHANAGIISALSSEDVLFLVDRMMHASGYDGLMLGRQHRGAEYKRFAHNDVGELESLIIAEKRKEKPREIIVVTESIFSMDGDLSPLSEIVALKRRYPDILLYLDEAHAIGVRGERGLGYAEETGLLDEVDIIVGTFGKAMASSGAFVATSGELRDFLINTSRSFIFSTAMPPVNAAWTLFMLDKTVGMDVERNHLKKLSLQFAELMNATLGCAIPGDTQIIPYLCGSAFNAVRIADRLREEGFDVLPIRYPTVPLGGERIRFSLNSSLDISDLAPLPGIIQQIRNSSFGAPDSLS